MPWPLDWSPPGWLVVASLPLLAIVMIAQGLVADRVRGRTALLAENALLREARADHPVTGNRWAATDVAEGPRGRGEVGRMGAGLGTQISVTEDETVEMFDEVIETKIAADGKIAAKRRVAYEQTVAEMELVDAAMEYAEAERRRGRLLARRGKRTAEEFDAIGRVYRCEKRLHALFCGGERSDMLNRMYNEYIRMLLNPPEPQA